MSCCSPAIQRSAVDILRGVVARRECAATNAPTKFCWLTVGRTMFTLTTFKGTDMPTGRQASDTLALAELVARMFYGKSIAPCAVFHASIRPVAPSSRCKNFYWVVWTNPSLASREKNAFRF
ncbi:unnamed protein product, partial [Ectocarpus sp. 4 AP-2014]